jgi:serine/threonine-protein kinase
MYAHIFNPPPQPTRINPEVPKEFDAIVAKGMTKDPAARFDTARELAYAARVALASSSTSPGHLTVTAGRPIEHPQAAVELETVSWDFRKDSSDPGSGSQRAIPIATPAGADPGPVTDLPGHEPVRGQPPTLDGETAAGEEAHPEQPRSVPQPPSDAADQVDEGRWKKRAALVFFAVHRPDSRRTSTAGTGPSLGAPAASSVPALPAPKPGRPNAVAASIAVPFVAARIPVGSAPGFIAVAPDGRYAYTANRDAKSLSVIDTTLNTVTATIPVTAGPPQFVAFAPDGRRAYLSIYDNDRSVNLVGVLDTASNKILTTVQTGLSPFALTVTPDGKYVYVPEHDSGRISVISTATDAVVTTINVPPNPHSIKFTNDGRRAYVANHDSNVVSVLATGSNTVLATVPTGMSPHSVAIAPDQTTVADVNYNEHTVSLIDTATNTVRAKIPVGAHPQDVAFAPDGQHAYTANSESGTVSVIDPRTKEVSATIPTGKTPTSIAVSPNGQRAYVTNFDSGDVTVLNIAG